MGEDDRDFFGELDEFESGDSVTLEQVSSSGRAQSLPSDSGVDLGGDEEGVSLSELETSLQESVSRAARARSTGSSDTCEEHFIDPDLGREKVREAHSAQKCFCREHNCLKAFKQEEIIKLRQNMMEMTNVDRDMLIMGKLQARSYARGADRQRTKFTYAIDYRTVCLENFLFSHALGDRVLRNIQEHMKQNGCVPRQHGNVGRLPANTIPFEATQQAVRFIHNFALVHGLPQPAAPRGRADTAPTYLPASENFRSVHAKYVEACGSGELAGGGVGTSAAQTSSQRVLKYRSFVSLWHTALPDIKFMTPRTDVCNICEKHRERIKLSVNEEEKLAATGRFQAHLTQAAQEREHEEAVCEEAASSLSRAIDAETVPSTNHHTFDFSQQVFLPYNARQVGPLYFKVPLRVCLFGVCDDGLCQQTNFTFSEAECIGLDGGKSHGGNAVVSMLHSYLENKTHGEADVKFHADNCCGQNKNRHVVGYFAWRTITEQHWSITISFMRVGHMRCLVDGFFGQLKKKYRRSDVDTMEDLVDVIARSSNHNEVARRSSWTWYNWEAFVDGLFKSIKGITTFQHFRFASSSPGVVFVREAVDAPEKEVRLLKAGVSVADVEAAPLPEELHDAGLSTKRKEYLYKEVREFVAEGRKDILCPCPDRGGGMSN